MSQEFIAESNTPPPVQLEWRLLNLMAERKIRTATELARRLETVGVHLSAAHLSRLVTEAPSRLSLELLAGLMTVLDCDAGDLIAPVGRMRPHKHEDPVKVDRGTLREILAGLEQGLEETRRYLPPDKKAEVIALLYEMYMEEEDAKPGAQGP